MTGADAAIISDATTPLASCPETFIFRFGRELVATRLPRSGSKIRGHYYRNASRFWFEIGQMATVSASPTGVKARYNY